MNSSKELEVIIDERMKLFHRYLNYTNMEHKKYQYDGIKWCLNNELGTTPLNIKGGFIADEMGLGKTIMMIGLTYCNFIPHTLIVVPNILVSQWYKQIYKTTGYKPLIYYGNNKKNISIKNIYNSFIVITTYTTISLNENKIKNKKLTLIHNIKWSRIIYDEAHHLRNKNNSRYLGANSLNSNIIWLVSGTPIQNKKEDFYNLCNILKLTSSYYKNKENLLEILKYFVLKRTKKQVSIEMTKLIIKERKITWQSNIEKNIACEFHSCLKFSSLDCKKNKTTSFVNNIKKKGVLPLLLYSKQICILPKLLTNKLNSLYLSGFINDYDYNYYCEGLNYSSKLDALMIDLNSNKNNGCGKLIFCHFKGEIDEIYNRLTINDFHNISIIDGRLTENERNNILNKKNDILILQIQVGCEGLNLQQYYNEIYFVSSHWNPSIEDQAIARCHRIGQSKNVIVYKYSMDSFTSNIKDNEYSNYYNDKDIIPINIDNYINFTQNIKRNIASKMLTQ
jgi:SNF2 family DNA or RNA helicase